MPRPHIPHHLSLQRIKSSTGSTNAQPPSSVPGTPPLNSRNASPNRGSTSSNGTKGGEGKGDHRNMGLVLRVDVVRGSNLAPKDKRGTSDPFLIMTLGDAKAVTSAVSKTLNPEWNQTFEFPVTTSDSALLEVVCWDKDRFSKDYMGEFDVLLEDIFLQGHVMPEPKWFKLESRRASRKKKKKDENVTGEVLLRFTLFDPINTGANEQQILSKFSGVVADPADDEDMEEEELMRRLALGDDGLGDVSEEDEEDKIPSDETSEGARTPSAVADADDAHKRRRQSKAKRLKRKSRSKAFEFSGMSDVAGVLYLEISRITDLPPEKNSTRTTFDMDPFVITSLGRRTYRTRVINHNLNPVYEDKLVFQIQKHEVNYHLNFTVVDRDKFSGNDFVGTCSFPLETVKNLAPEADPETGLYRLPDPDLPAHEPERRRRFRLPLSRSSSQTNIGRTGGSNETYKQASFDTLALPSRPMNKHMASAEDIQEHTRPAPTSNPSTRSVQPEADSAEAENGHARGDMPGLSSFELPLELKNKARWQDKHSPVLYIRAKYLPYRALRQQFWRAMLKQYDADESGRIDKVELVTMLDTLGSTLHNSTIDSFFRRFSESSGGEPVLSIDQAVICLEEQLMKTHEIQKSMHTPNWQGPRETAGQGGSMARALASWGSSPDASPGGGTPYLGFADRQHPSNMDPKSLKVPSLEVLDSSETGQRSGPGTPSLSRQDSMGTESEAELNDDPKEEHVVKVQECPICHMPRLDRGRRKGGPTDADIITHIATCASSDWRTVNNLVMGGFVTSSQAQRKWYSKVMTKISYGGYRLGANSANILVQDRITGMINEERMSVYVRLGIRLLYKGLKSREMEKKSIRKLLRSMSFKQGRKYDDPASASQIPSFINFHQLDMSEVLLPTEEFKTFNEFFYRKLKPDARPCSAANNPHIIVSPADCRTVVFNRLEDAQRIWVKGREFSIERLLGEAYPDDAKRYKNGALGIFRLAPQDYHRFHIPVDGTLGEPKLIEGEYYTVNPMAIRSTLDVYGENIRVCVPIDSVVHGRVMVICVGAMMVGSTVITRKQGEEVKRAEELGYFKFGGSTLLVLFEPGVMRFDHDLVGNANGALETLVRVGMSVGHSPTHEPHKPDMQKENPTAAEKQDAKRRIEGSLAPSSGINRFTMSTH